MLFTNPLLCVNRRKGSKNKRITNFFGDFFGLVALPKLPKLLKFPNLPFAAPYPSATSSTIITPNPTAKPIVERFECSPRCDSGISSSTTT